MGYKFKASLQISPKTMQNLLFKIDGTDDQMILSTAVLRSMMKARYSAENLGHFGLAASHYCHFTSPIRRYPDLMVHRILRLWLAGKLKKTNIKRMQKVTHQAALHSSETEYNATVAERDYVDYKMCEFMADKVGQDFTGVICSVTSFGFFVRLDNMVEGLVRMGDLKGDYYLYDEVSQTLVGKRGGKQYHIGQRVTVRLAKVNLELRQIDLVPVEGTPEKEPEKVEVKKKSGGKRRRRRGGKKKAGGAKQKSVS
jgi:ribonuclease R